MVATGMGREQNSVKEKGRTTSGKQVSIGKEMVKELLGQQEDFLKPLLETVAQEVLEAEMNEALGAIASQQGQHGILSRCWFPLEAALRFDDFFMLLVHLPRLSQLFVDLPLNFKKVTCSKPGLQPAVESMIEELSPVVTLDSFQIKRAARYGSPGALRRSCAGRGARRPASNSLGRQTSSPWRAGVPRRLLVSGPPLLGAQDLVHVIAFAVGNLGTLVQPLAARSSAGSAPISGAHCLDLFGDALLSHFLAPHHGVLICEAMSSFCSSPPTFFDVFLIEPTRAFFSGYSAA